MKITALDLETDRATQLAVWVARSSMPVIVSTEKVLERAAMLLDERKLMAARDVVENPHAYGAAKLGVELQWDPIMFPRLVELVVAGEPSDVLIHEIQLMYDAWPKDSARAALSCGELQRAVAQGVKESWEKSSARTT